MSIPAEVDVVVLGAGASGLAAALAADAAGAETIVLETHAPERHTPNVRMSGGWVMTVRDAVEGAKYLRACAGGLVEDSRVDDWAYRSTGLRDWLGQLGVDLQDTPGLRAPEHPDLPGAQAVEIRRARTDLPTAVAGQGGYFPAHGPAEGGEALYRGLMHAVLASNVEIAWDTRASSLVIAPDGRVQGVRLSDSDRVLNARKGVVIATGGFGASAELVRNHLAVPDTRFYGNPRNDGGGLRLAVSAGAKIARMNRFVGRGIASCATEDGDVFGFMMDMGGGGYIMCDKTGRRYADEFPQAALFHDFYYQMQHFDSALHDYTRSPSYYVFDQQRMDAGPLTFVERGVCGVGLYEWSEDNSKELAQGWIGRGETPAEAAAAVGAQKAATFDEAVSDYNAGCASGIDRFGRPPESLVPLASPPYYCIPLYVGGPHTTGGVERDARGRVLGALDGRPIPGLFGAGESGQAIGLLYPAAGCALSDALCSGLSAGESAAGLAE